MPTIKDFEKILQLPNGIIYFRISDECLKHSGKQFIYETTPWGQPEKQTIHSTDDFSILENVGGEEKSYRFSCTSYPELLRKHKHTSDNAYQPIVLIKNYLERATGITQRIGMGMPTSKGMCAYYVEIQVQGPREKIAEYISKKGFELESNYDKFLKTGVIKLRFNKLDSESIKKIRALCNFLKLKNSSKAPISVYGTVCPSNYMEIISTQKKINDLVLKALRGTMKEIFVDYEDIVL